MPDDQRSLGETLYDRDFRLWAERQGAALLALREAFENSAGDALHDAVAAIDLSNIAEEIEGLARSDRREVRSRLDTIVEHLIKLESATQRDPWRGWRVTIVRERQEVAALIAESPSLRSVRDDALPEARRNGLDRAFAALLEHGDTAGAERAERRGVEHLTADLVLGDWLPDAPA